MKKILSVILSLLITVQLAIIIPALASSQSGEAAGALLINDFSEYSLVTSKSGANDFRNALDWEGTWAVKNDASAKGGKYLSFSHGEKTANYTSDLRSSQTLPAAQPPRAAGSLPQIQNIG